MIRRLQFSIVTLSLIFGGGLLAQQLTLPNQKDSLKFAVIGDTGTGDANQYRTAEKLIAFRQQFAYEFLLMLGDNTYGGESAQDFQRRFETPYKPLLDAGVKFYAALGNHDTPNQRFYKLFNMGGQQYYTFRPKPGVRCFALDGNYMNPQQQQWLQKELTASGSEWKIASFIIRSTHQVAATAPIRRYATSSSPCSSNTT